MNLLVFIATVILSLLLAPALVRLASRYGIHRHDESGRLRQRVITLSGGTAIFISFATVTTLAFLFSQKKWLGSYDWNFLGAMLGSALMIILGLSDTARKVPLSLKIAVQALAGLVLFGCGYRITSLSFFPGDAIALGWAGPILLIVWVVGMTNAFSLIDSIDGLAAGIAAIAAITLFFAGMTGPPFVPVLALAAAGSCAGFLRYNFYPARIRLGRSGTFFLGFILAAIAAQGEFKATAGIALLLPILALLAAGYNRLRPLLPGGQEDKPRQLHNRLLRLGYSPRQTVLLLLLLQANLGVIALVAAAAGKTLALGIFFLVGTMIYLLFNLVEEYRTRILALNREEADRAAGGKN
ncbi:MAG: MraY family glycosyltransferase [Candidatus Erginobacter occultus]|nr:MraY family glycosyltransferase [Candidatus Erginobacter occultus]